MMSDREFQDIVDFFNDTIMMKCSDFLEENNGNHE